MDEWMEDKGGKRGRERTGSQAKTVDKKGRRKEKGEKRKEEVCNDGTNHCVLQTRTHTCSNMA